MEHTRMDAPPTQIAALGLGPATVAVLVRSTLDALPHPVNDVNAVDRVDEVDNSDDGEITRPRRG
jgi:hypothetical protein